MEIHNIWISAIIFRCCTCIILGAIYKPWAILRGLQKFSGLFSYMEKGFFQLKYIHPIFMRKKTKSKMNSLLYINEENEKNYFCPRKISLKSIFHPQFLEKL